MRLEYFELVDRIVAIDPPGGTITAQCRLPEHSPVFEGHFDGHPILPGVLMIEAMAQTGGWLLMAQVKFERMAFLASVRQAKMRRFLSPGQMLTIEATRVHEGSGYAVVTARILSDGRAAADTEITFRVLPFPNEIVRASILKAAARVALPAEWLPNV